MKIETGLKIELAHPQKGIQSFRIGDEFPDTEREPSLDHMVVSADGQYVRRKDGVYKKTTSGVFEWVMPYIKVKEIHKGNKGDVYERIVEFYDSEGNLKTETISQQELESGTEMFDKLCKKGFNPSCHLII